MELKDLIQRQREFDERHETNFAWSEPITAEQSGPLIHNVLALAGEVGELANLVKKYDRGDFGFDVLIELLPSELADIFIYLVKIAYQSGVDLEAAFDRKLSENEVRFSDSESGPGHGSV